MSDLKPGPLETKLIIHRISLRVSGHTDAILFLAGNGLATSYPEEKKWVREAINLVLNAPDCTYNNREEVAGMILDLIKNKADPCLHEFKSGDALDVSLPKKSKTRRGHRGGKNNHKHKRKDR